jgi:alcohol dehydrogenase class IV
MPVTYESLPSKVVFGKGALAQAGELMAGLGARRVLVIATRSQAGVAAALMAQLGEAGAALFDRAAMHTPVEVTLEAMAIVEAERIDGLLSVGGGSAIGLSKAIALRNDLPQLVIPTTYAGSEMTPVVGQTEAGAKTTQRSPRVLPEAVIYDVALTLGLPVGVSVTSGFNAMAHAVEALWARAPNPLLSAVGEDCVRTMANALPRIVLDPADEAARADALGAAWLGGWSLANGGSALHHRLCHILGGAFGLPHAETHTILLPHAVAYNAPSAPDAVDRLERALAAERPADALYDLAQSLGAPAALKDIGMPEDGVGQAIATLLADPPWNPRPLEPAPLADMLHRAWAGRRPHGH